jgi:hypothetical protein
MSKYKFILSGGGTGGHIYPAIAIANELKLRFPDAEFLFVGAKDKMEMQKVPQSGYDIKGLWIAGLQRKLTLQNAMFMEISKNNQRFQTQCSHRNWRFCLGTFVANGKFLEYSNRNSRTKFLSWNYKQIIKQKSQQDLCGLRKFRSFFPKTKNDSYRKSSPSRFN